MSRAHIKHWCYTREVKLIKIWMTVEEYRFIEIFVVSGEKEVMGSFT